jgi:hypothetical protein
MKITELYKIEIPENKLEKYLLNISHPDGYSKALFFKKHGYEINNSDLLEVELKKFANIFEVSKTIETQFGTKFIIDGFIKSFINQIIEIRTIWFVEKSDSKNAKLVTVYPL